MGDPCGPPGTVSYQGGANDEHINTLGPTNTLIGVAANPFAMAADGHIV